MIENFCYGPNKLQSHYTWSIQPTSQRLVLSRMQASREKDCKNSIVHTQNFLRLWRFGCRVFLAEKRGFGFCTNVLVRLSVRTKAIETLHFTFALHSFGFIIILKCLHYDHFTACILSLRASALTLHRRHPILYVNLNMTSALYARCLFY